LVPVPLEPLPMLPEPVLPALGTEPEDDEPGALGDVVVVPLEVSLPLAPAPAEPCRRRQSSRWVPVRPTHWLGVTVAPAAAEPLVLPVAPVALPPLVVDEESLALGVALRSVELPVPPAAALPVEEAPDDASVEPDVPVPEPDDWANVTEESARSAAAVAAVIVFNIMG
jgi:hypothetical protein